VPAAEDRCLQEADGLELQVGLIVRFPFQLRFQRFLHSEDLVGGAASHNYTKHPSSPEHAGLSVFFKDTDGAIYHTYSCYPRGLDLINGAYSILDLAPKGRDEEGLPNTIAWMEWHDEYND
jgi:predicted dithiol-disulfide oxidoreductase (DUF899 family)